MFPSRSCNVRNDERGALTWTRQALTVQMNLQSLFQIEILLCKLLEYCVVA